jgi:hypothetical protein
MKSLLKLAMGAAIAGALVNILKQRSGKSGSRASCVGSGASQTSGFTPTELVADTNSVGEGSGDERVLLPDDGRVGQGKLNS